MITAAFALLSCIGAWMTWRRTPFYSLRATFRLLGALLVLVGAAAGLIVLTLKLTDGRSAAVQGVALGVVVLLSAWGLIFGISAASTPAEARLTTTLPPNVALSTLNRARIRPWLRRAAWTLVVTLLLALIPGPVRFIALSFAAMIVFFALIMFPVGYVTALRTDRAVTALQLHPWVHWHYAPGVWSDWIARLGDRQAQLEAAKITPAGRRWLILFLTLFAVGYAVIAVPASALYRALWALASGAVVLGISLLAGVQSRKAPQRIARRLQAAPADTFFGHDGMLCNGEFCAWRGTDVTLQSATREAGAPTCLEFLFEKIVPAGYGGSNVPHVRQWVLIPADAATTDLPSLQAALVARCPDARISLT